MTQRRNMIIGACLSRLALQLVELGERQARGCLPLPRLRALIKARVRVQVVQAPPLRDNDNVARRVTQYLSYLRLPTKFGRSAGKQSTCL